MEQGIRSPGLCFGAATDWRSDCPSGALSHRSQGAVTSRVSSLFPSSFLKITPPMLPFPVPKYSTGKNTYRLEVSVANEEEGRQESGGGGVS